MTDKQTVTDGPTLALQYAAENRRAEISLLWTRSSFFWAFLAVAIASYGGAIHTQHRTLGLLVACFASICSLGWALANRAGKYWQEVWEKKTGEAAKPVLGPRIFPRESNPTTIQEDWFLQAKQYSPSRLAIAISDLTFLLWCIIAIGTAAADFLPSPPLWCVAVVRLVALAITVLVGVSMLIWCRSGASRPTRYGEGFQILLETICSLRLPSLGSNQQPPTNHHKHDHD